jgi:uncharacterized protein (TIGR02001 family)
MRTGVLRVLAPLTATAVASGPALAGEWHASVAATSNYVVHGLTRSANEPAIQANVGWTNDRNWSAGIWTSTVELLPYEGPSQELDFYIARAWQPTRDWRFSGRLTRYEFPGDPGAFSYDYTELAASASFREYASFSVSAIPDYSMHARERLAVEETAMTYELAGQLPLSPHVRLTAGIGRSDVDPLSYWYWSGGAEAAWRRVSLGISYLGADNTAERLFGSRWVGNVWVATLAFRVR